MLTNHGSSGIVCMISLHFNIAICYRLICLFIILHITNFYATFYCYHFSVRYPKVFWNLSKYVPLVLSQLAHFTKPFPQRQAARTTQIGSYVITTNRRLYGSISQIFLLYKTWGYYNKCDSTKSMGTYYWYVKIPQCGVRSMGQKILLFVFNNI